MRRWVQVLVVLLIVGVTAVLIATGISRLRQSAEAVSCQNNLKQLGLAIRNYESAYGYWPPLVDQGEGSPTGTGLPSVFHELTPFLESSIRMYSPHGAERKSATNYYAHSSVEFPFIWKDGERGTQRGGDANQCFWRFFHDPADATATNLRDVPMTLPDGSTGYYATGSYAANGMLPWGVRGRLSNELASSILFAERPQVCRTATGEDVHNLWGVGFYSPHMPAFATLTPTDPPGLWSTGQIAPARNPPNTVRIGRQDATPEPPGPLTPLQFIRPGQACDPRLPGTPHRGGLQAAMGDGSVRVFAPGTDAWVFWAACTTAVPADEP